MMDQAAEILIPPHPYRPLQRIERKIRTQVIRDLPALSGVGQLVTPGALAVEQAAGRLLFP